jgi:hypothetical protein
LHDALGLPKLAEEALVDTGQDSWKRSSAEMTQQILAVHPSNIGLRGIR